MKWKALFIFCLLFVFTGATYAQLIFEKSEYITRREKLMDIIPDGIAVFRGASLPEGVSQFFQYNNMMYFAGLEIPNVILIIDGVTRTSTLFFTISENEAKSEGISEVESAMKNNK
jgi:Xaa-Pro aminopeptidase